MTRENGYLIIDDYQKIEKDCIGNFSKGWYTDGEDEYLFKDLPLLSSYKELFYPLLLKELGLSVPENDLAKLNNKYGIISKNYNPENYLICNIEKIITEYKNNIKQRQKYSYNLEELPYIIKWYCKNNKLKYSLKIIKKDLLVRYIIQIIFGDADLLSRNMELEFYENKSARILHFFDFSFYGNINLFNEDIVNHYYFGQRNLSCEKYFNPKEIIKDFLKTGNQKDIELLKEYLEKAKMLNLESKIAIIEEQICTKVPEEIKLKLLKDTRRVFNEVSEVIK